jgi:sulfate adenylyltransferase
MIKPHGSDQLTPLYVLDDKERQDLLKQAENLPSVVVSSAAAANAVMLGAGYFNPLEGYMSLADAISIADNMKTTGGLFWPTPIVNVLPDVSAIKGATRIALRDPNVDGNPVIAIQDVSAIDEASDAQMKQITEKVYKTLDMEHPGVKAFNTVGKFFVSGPIQVLSYSYFASEFPETFRTAYQIRAEMEKLGWNKVVAFQTRNPMHRAHEELCRMAHEALGTDGILVHMLLGKLKKGDIPADVRDNCIRTMVKHYFPANTVMITGYGFDMLYAGPREAVLHAIFRQNSGCTHLIVGRDHAGVGDYYGAFDAQEVFHKEVPAGALELQVFEADHTAYSKKIGKVIMMRDGKDHTKDDWVFLSGTKVRAMLSEGQDLPTEFSRPEVAAILKEYYMANK